MTWSQLELEKAHIAYACIGIFSTIFSLVSLFVKERLYIGEATVATIAGLILGPHCLGWFEPVTWGNSDYMTLEICRIVLCIQIVAVAVELPRKYMKKHWLSVAIFLFPVMTCGWLVVGLFIWVLIPHFNFSSALLVSACVTATDPVLAAAVVGKGKFAERVPGHLRNVLSAESGCNDGMAFPFIFLSLNIILHPGNAGEIVKDWFLLTILWECFFGVALGVILGLLMRYAVAFAKKKGLIDRESFLAVFVFLAFNSAGIGSMLGVDDLLVSFAAGTAFGWNGDFAKKTEESHVSTVIDLILNLSFFVYFGAIVPWPEFNNAAIGLNVWRLIILALVIIFLRRMPAVLILKPFTPDIKSWREALFCGHFGPIGVGAIFAAILARKDLETHFTSEETPLAHLPKNNFPHYQLLACIWPIVCFIVITSIIVHGSSVAVLTLGKRLNRMAITMSFTTTNTQDQGPSWMSRLQKLDRASTSFSLHRIDTQVPPTEKDDKLQQTNTVETSGIKVRPAGGAKRRKHKKKREPRSRLKKSLSRTSVNSETNEGLPPQRHKPQAEFLQLGRTPSTAMRTPSDEESEPESIVGIDNSKEDFDDSPGSSNSIEVVANEDQGTMVFAVPPYDSGEGVEQDEYQDNGKVSFARNAMEGRKSVPSTAFQEGEKIIIEDQAGEIIETLPLKSLQAKPENEDDLSIHSMSSLGRQLSKYSTAQSDGASTETSLNTKEKPSTPLGKLARSSTLSLTRKGKRKGYYKKNDPKHRKVFAHQVDNFIVIENADGDIIRRYKVNRHSAHRARSNTGNSMIGKALNFVGLKKNTPKDNVNANDLEKNDRENVLIPEHDATNNPNHPLKDPKFENAIESKLTKILLDDRRQSSNFLSVGNRPETVQEGSERGASDDNYDTTSGSEETDEDDDEILEETDIEKKRRLAALGKMPTHRRKEDEED